MPEKLLKPVQLPTGAPLIAVQRAWSRLARFSNQSRMYAMVLERAGLSIDHSSLPLLEYLQEFGPTRMTVAADALGLDLSTLSRQVTVLKDRGLLVQILDPLDNRARILRPTARGKRVLAKIDQASLDVLGDTLQHWSEEDLHTLVTMLNRLSVDGERNLSAHLSTQAGTAKKARIKRLPQAETRQ